MTSPVLQPLLAKSRPKDGSFEPPTVEEHCLHVHDAAKAVWDAIEDDFADAIGVNVAELRDTVQPLFFIAATLHDIAKANSAFQAILRKTGHKKQRQPIRHEILAAVLLTNERFWGDWLPKALPNELDRWAVVWAVGGHHLQLRDRRFGEVNDPLFETEGVPKEVSVYLSEQQVLTLLDRVRSIAKSRGHDPGEPPTCETLAFDPLDESDAGLEMLVRRFVRNSKLAWRTLRHDETFKRNLALLKALLIAADVAGSGLPTANEPISAWIGTHLAVRLRPEDADEIVKKNLGSRTPHQFQERVAESPHPVTIVTAGCGNGKTTAAYMWASKWAKGRKLIFAYPTTGTASAGFEDYLFAQSELERDLLHGRAGADLQVMFDAASDVSPIETTQRLEALNAWRRQAITCTVDTVLGLIQNQRRPLFAFPVITAGAFVFDEIHSYDKRLFGELLRFLKAFPGVPVLIMSASIPPKRLDELRKAVAGHRISPEPILGDHDIEGIKRYKLHNRAKEDCWTQVEKVLGKKSERRKVLWVCNTVNEAVEVYKEAKRRFSDIKPLETILYHSRYRYGGDSQFPGRVERQNQVREEFRYVDDEKTQRMHERPSLVVATQVCEMSLDISADLLVTELCPLPSLVQRLGRLNRYASKDDPKPAFIYSFKGRPYHKEDYPAQMQAAQAMIDKIEGKACDQTTLANFIEAMPTNEEWTEYSAWLDGGWQSEPLPVRDGGNTITVLWGEDVDRLAAILKKPANRLQRQDVIPLTIPMLILTSETQRRLKIDFRNTVAGYPVIESHGIRYDEEEGASWAG
ncbi:MAG: CRISPR-associated helicase Cas3' [Planctomycetaceae bacterium]|nr:CRISPR-associated helicase Cas3' [Planctomycetaceae bacterium]